MATEKSVTVEIKIRTAKPPLGVKPRWLHDYERMADLAEAMHRYEKAGYPVPPEWLEEFVELTRRMVERYNNGQK